eukprot:GHVT01043181.1.p1 GENE.GHVT01043181.1~~GHVT01043181.1.p1  ORF type:complete len:372 (+),score=104.09 GHVT01043181.1:415-1530(+)
MEGPDNNVDAAAVAASALQAREAAEGVAAPISAAGVAVAPGGVAADSSALQPAAAPPSSTGCGPSATSASTAAEASAASLRADGEAHAPEISDPESHTEKQNFKSEREVQKLAGECDGEETAASLLAAGRALFRVKEFTEAASVLSRAVEQRVAELGDPSSDFHPSLAPYYLWFGDALLSKEETTNNLLHTTTATHPEDSAGSSGAAADGAEVAASVSDEQLAFEMLDMSRQTLERKRSDAAAVSRAVRGAGSAPSPSPSPLQTGKQDAVDSTTSSFASADWEELAYVHIRIGDIFLVNQQFDDAAEEYRKAGDCRASAGAAREARLAPLVAEAQATFFAGKIETALTLYRVTNAQELLRPTRTARWAQEL